ncbi:hypothetical protein [Ralstonia sp. ASV6]|uniref:hypothetical protein n=1 Tax=Ralstonia sp. ASV6 TaxID=2795124 RepID=UPI0018EDDB25|nr:hypothetical protein [Ralstonia sp. ASV6]
MTTGRLISADTVRAALSAQGRAADTAQVQKIVVAVSHLDVAISRLKTAADKILEGADIGSTVTNAAQDEAMRRVVGRSLELVDSMMLMRDSIAEAMVDADDTDVQALLKVAEAVTGRMADSVTHH